MHTHAPPTTHTNICPTPPPTQTHTRAFVPKTFFLPPPPAVTYILESPPPPWIYILPLRGTQAILIICLIIRLVGSPVSRHFA